MNAPIPNNLFTPLELSVVKALIADNNENDAGFLIQWAWGRAAMPESDDPSTHPQALPESQMRYDRILHQHFAEMVGGFSS